MARPGRPCPTHGCPNLQPCPTHTRQPWSGTTRRRRLPPDWDTRRTTVLERDDYRCQLAYPSICITYANEVDHIQHGDDHRLTNLQAACHPCHAHKSAIEGNTAMRDSKP